MTNQLIATSAISQAEKVSDTTQRDHQMIDKFFPKSVHRVSNVIHSVYGWHKWSAYALVMKTMSFSIRKKLKPRDKAFYNSGKKSFFKLGKAKLVLYTYGQGPKVLLLHGWCSNGARWRDYVSSLVDAGYQAVVVDAPGHGTAPGRFFSVPQFVDAARELILSDQWVACVSHSMGALAAGVAMGEIEEHQRPEKLVMMNTFCTAESLMTKFALGLGIKPHIVRETQQDYVPTYHNDVTIEHYCLIRHRESLPKHTMVIADDQDIVVPRGEIEKIESHIAGPKIVRTTGLGHNLRSPQIVSDTMKFITQ